MPLLSVSDTAVVDLTVALLGTADSWPLLLLVVLVVVPAVWSRDTRRRRRARQVLRLLRPQHRRCGDGEPRP
ncbi:MULTISPECIES: hypothetical protein [Nocardiopsis]|uniref:Uncharacterized protein n=1 Tax=Nocardiopsis dassonvillei (strain ATCC 23218 / DSM 43111 / CIP 107115 / JCM 7437 / KCTC 9190 / NBRC 14626 / NCTC 10488 / NRRL B-5397 / IMRU 509) TaxID=446468 RepID=D7AYN6_NOCDD|nr:MULTISPECIES: hypothetical protein [Nocardiopsis]ADH68048.1 hypothetical protein Ndas_2631 [Nocardiopsis dassonvillei subsp. dassonvillei DSM 43111]APC36192.1 hypothetical protein A9R04_16505 [Nocardiopsis dassonvillei]NKY81464.1 hypothetical protein [Nocardiopsis dassonvillei]VEI88547.1 Uncharacterised protein [Nocardiopsis dassonvillei]